MPGSRASAHVTDKPDWPSQGFKITAQCWNEITAHLPKAGKAVPDWTQGSAR